MTNNEDFISPFYHVERVWIEMTTAEQDACDVIVRMEDGSLFTAMFVTLAYFQRQMTLNLEMTSVVEGTLPVRFAALDTPHLLVQDLDRNTIEDVIDNLIAMENFESLFIRVTEPPSETPGSTTNDNGRLATQEVAAVVIEEVLVVD